MNPYNMYIAASAGSGKTYQLVNRFIALLCIQKLSRQPIEVSKLMAITFTRKAAGEFKSRILSSLAQASSSPEEAQEFWAQRIDPCLRQFEPNYEVPSQPQAIFLSLLRSVMEQFGQLQLSTIDSLLERMMRGLSPELGISAISIIDPLEEELYRRKALSASYLSTQSEDEMSRLADIFNESQSSDGALSSPDRSLMSLIKEHHQSYIKSPKALWGGKAELMTEEELAVFGLSPDDIRTSLSEAEYEASISTLKSLLLQVETVFPKPSPIKDNKEYCTIGDYPLEIAIPPRSRSSYRNAFINLAQSLCQKQGDIVLPKPNKFILNPTLESMEHEYYPAYWHRCHQHGVDINAVVQTRQSRQWQQILNRTHAIAQIVQNFEDCYNQEVRQTGALGFADIANLIQNRADETTLEKLQERIDLSIAHWMLDEFQDTSHQQYQILLNLLQSRSQGGDEGCVFMVGDTKQSIYQFRGGDPEIFIKARQEIFGISDQNAKDSKQTMSLNKSYRSAPEVLELSNMLFSPDTFPNIAEKSLPASRAQWERFQYTQHVSNKTELKGCAEIWQLQKAGKDFCEPDWSQDDILMHSIAAKLAEFRPSGCTSPPSCAILVSTRSQGKKAQEFLLAHQAEYGFEGPVLLNAKKQVGVDSVLGLALIQFFSWLNTPGDKRSLGLLKLSPLWLRIEQMGGGPAWSPLRELWSNKGCTAVLNKLFEKDEPQLITNDYLRQRKKIWLETAAQFDSLGGNISAWITHMRALEKAEESQGNEVTIMTIHQSKGLEFDCVFIPIFGKTSPFIDLTKINLLTKTNAQGQDLAVLLRPAKSLSQSYPKFEQCMLEPRLVNEEVGGYCRLYVAITRAKLASYIMLPPPPKEESKSESFNTLLHKLSEQQPAPTVNTQIMHPDGVTPLADCTLRLGDTAWYQHREQKQAVPKAVEVEPDYNYHFTSLPRSTPSGLDRDRTQDVEEIPTAKSYPLSESKGAAFGSLVHGLFEQVSWLGDPLPDWSGVDATAVATIDKSLRSPTWAPYFTRPEGAHQLYREQNIECILNGNWVSGQIDRMVVRYAQGLDKPASSAHIIDFKTDANLGEAEGKAHYRAQMQAYRSMVALAFDLSPEQVRVTLLHCPAYGEPEAWDFHELDWQS